MTILVDSAARNTLDALEAILRGDPAEVGAAVGRHPAGSRRGATR